MVHRHCYTGVDWENSQVAVVADFHRLVRGSCRKDQQQCLVQVVVVDTDVAESDTAVAVVVAAEVVAVVQREVYCQ